MSVGMGRLSRAAIFAFAYLTLVTTSAATVWAQASDVDWKLYGHVPIDGSMCWLFYEANSVKHQPDGNIQVWTKCLLQKDLEGIDPEKYDGGEIMKSAAQEVAHYYVPPFALINNVSVDQILEWAVAEATANLAHLQPPTRILYELNCSERRSRELSVSVHWENGKSDSSEKPRDWVHVPPEGNAATLLKLLCPR